PRFVGLQLRRAFEDALLQRLVQPPELDFRLLGRGDVMGDADEADVLAGRVPARLRFRAQPVPFVVGALVARFQHERFQRSLSGNLRLQDARQVVRMQRLAPIEHDGFLERKAEEIEIGLIGERARAIELGDPDRHRRAVGDQAEALLALAQSFASQYLVGDVDMRAFEPERATGLIALEFGDDANPPDLTIVRPDDPVFGGIILVRSFDGIEEVPDGCFAILGMNAVDPVLVRLVGGIWWQAVDYQIFGRTAVLETFAKIDLDAADPPDALNARKFGLALLQGVMRAVAFSRGLFQMLPQPFS